MNVKRHMCVNLKLFLGQFAKGVADLREHNIAINKTLHCFH